ncbi:hypothetical protein [Amycolatopsis pithecellobii]|uniref:Uncharacterized protein n=1 Tax=Amycolatopsis pithecellobii TaxID=664692 RepID=A0A6N7Z6J0_9PSEU|nr:hypothetical protein [Amycolatopsis pithecellobii]MTD56524.1 hypothetical protein [Amycolatopsis pithecellobii]
MERDLGGGSRVAQMLKETEKVADGPRLQWCDETGSPRRHHCGRRPACRLRRLLHRRWSIGDQFEQRRRAVQEPELVVNEQRGVGSAVVAPAELPTSRASSPSVII